MHPRLVISLIIIIAITCNYCENDNIVLLRFKTIEYKRCFIGDPAKGYEVHHLYVKNLDLTDYEKLRLLQEFALCYGKGNSDVVNIVFLNKYFYDAEDFRASSIRVSIRLVRSENQLLIRDILYLENRKILNIGIPILEGNSINCH